MGTCEDRTVHTDHKNGFLLLNHTGDLLGDLGEVAILPPSLHLCSFSSPCSPAASRLNRNVLMSLGAMEATEPQSLKSEPTHATIKLQLCLKRTEWD